MIVLIVVQDFHQIARLFLDCGVARGLGLDQFLSFAFAISNATCIARLLIGASRVRIGTTTVGSALQRLPDVGEDFLLHLCVVHKSYFLVSKLVLVLQHALLEVLADFLKSIDVTVFSGRELAGELLHALLARYLVSQGLDLALDVSVENLAHFFFISWPASLILLSLEE